MTAHIREVTGKPVGFKAVVGALEPLAELFQLIRERDEEAAPDFIVIDRGEGGADLPILRYVACAGAE